jgi:hypothetical protein
VRAGPTRSDTWRSPAVVTDEGAAARTRPARHRSWRGAAPSRYILEYLKDVNLEYTSAMSVLDCSFSEVKVHKTHQLVMGCPNSGILPTFTAARDPSPGGYSVITSKNYFLLN